MKRSDGCYLIPQVGRHGGTKSSVTTLQFVPELGLPRGSLLVSSGGSGFRPSLRNMLRDGLTGVGTVL